MEVPQKSKNTATTQSSCSCPGYMYTKESESAYQKDAWILMHTYMAICTSQVTEPA